MANFSVLRICSPQTVEMGSTMIIMSVRTLVMMMHFSTRIWSLQRPMRSMVHCCSTGSQRKMKTNVKTMAHATMMAPAP